MRWMTLVGSLLLVLGLAGCDGRPDRIRIVHAGSLSVPFLQLEEAFEARNPGLDLQRQAYGSAAAVRQVTDLGRPVDLVGVSDYQLIDRMMIQASPRTAEWNVLFARNAIGIAWREGTEPVTPQNWAEVLAAGEATYGISDPNRDPCGYRSLFAIYLAGGEKLLRELILSHSNIELRAGDDVAAPSTIEVEDPLILRPKETDLVGLLEAGGLDYLFIYQSVAVQHGLEFMELPPEANLADPARVADYARVRIVQNADLPQKSVSVAGAPIVYGVTVPGTAQHPEAAARLVRFLLSETWKRMMQEAGQEPLRPAVLSPVSRPAAAPVALEKLEG
ncbi:MAG: tungstate ABC transporter substrate-binding protein WtpA [Planctomycetota bacterium]